MFDMNEREKERRRDGYAIRSISDMLVALLLVWIQLSIQTKIEYEYLGR